MSPLALSDDAVQQLKSIANSRSLPNSIVQRTQIVLAYGSGETNMAIPRSIGLTGMTVGRWQECCRDLGLKGLHDQLRPGRPRTYVDDKAAEVINRALQSKPADGTLGGQIAPWRLLPASPKARLTAGCRPSPCRPTARNPAATR